jgi:flagellar L-ring protein precursor FlgH
MDRVEPAQSPTSLWNSNAALTKAYDDHRARRIGDLVTVVVSESSEASRSASTDLSRDTEMGLGIDAMLGAPDHLGLPGLFKGGNDFSPTVSASTGNSFSGGGSTSRKESLKTNVAARVMEILPDGNMVVEGRRQVEVNDDIQYIYVRGMARPVDISPNNTISSSALADAEIVYNGTGAISNEQKPGWAYRLFSAVWPF